MFRVRICKRLRSPGIDSKEGIDFASLCSQTGRYDKYGCRTGQLSYRGWQNRFQIQQYLYILYVTRFRAYRQNCLTTRRQKPRIGGSLRQINNCGKILFHVTFFTKRFCIAFYESYSSTLKKLHCKDTIPKILNKYSQERNCAATVPIPSFMFLRAIYIFP